MEVEKDMFIVNPRSWKGQVKKYLKKIFEFKEGPAKEKGREVTIETTEPDGVKTAFNLAREAAYQGYCYLGVIGGDGTINGVTNGIINSGIPFKDTPAIGIVRTGLGDDFARGLGIPKGVDWLLETLSQEEASIQDKIIAVDLGEVAWEGGSRVFVNVFGVGIDARITKFAVAFKQMFWFLSFLPFSGEAMYLPAGLIELLRLYFKHHQVKIDMDGKSFSNRILLVAVANGPCYGRIFKLAPQANIQDGLLDICQVKKAGRFRMLLNIPRFRRGTHLFRPEVETFSDGRLPRTASLTISSSEDLPCQMDGEVLPAKKEYRVSILPKRLKVLVP